MIPVNPGAVNVIEARPTRVMAKMRALIAVPGMAAILVPESAVTAPIAIYEGAVISIIQPSIVSRRPAFSVDRALTRSRLMQPANIARRGEHGRQRKLL